MKQINHFSVIFFILVLSSSFHLFLSGPEGKVIAQPVAGFTYTLTNGGCEPDSVAFTNTSTGAVFYEWDFGDFTPIDTNINTYHWYPACTYLVVLTSFDSLGNSDVATSVITIETVPFVSYWANPNVVCPGSAVYFENSSWPIGSDFLWYFGDGDSSNTFNPTHTYTGIGAYPVTLIASTLCGIDTSFIDTVWVVPQVSFSADFGTDPNPACPGQFIEFNNGSWPVPVSNLWYFGDGDSSVAFNPTHAYTDTGIYIVTLIAYSDCNSDTISKPIIIDDSIIPSVSAGVFPNISCPGDPIQFNGSNFVITSFFWDFDDGNFSFLEDPVYAYPDTGIYNVTFTGTNSCGISNTDIVIITIIDSFAAFTSFWWSPSDICPNDLVTFEYSSSSPIDILWDFDDGDTSVERTPTHAFTDTGTYNVQLIFENSCGI